MIRSILVVVTATLLHLPALTQNYAVGAIPPQLLTEANIVKRVDDRQFEIVSTKETILRRKWALTILNEAGSEHAYLAQSYDQLNKIISIEGALYDANGKLISRLKPKDIQDQSAGTDNLHDDARIKTHEFNHRSYPYTIEYEVITKKNHTLFLDYWFPQDREFLSVEYSTFTVIAPQAITYRFKAFNYPWAPQKSEVNGKTHTVWRAKELPAIRRPFASPHWRELTTCVLLAPDQFEIQGYTGTMTSWADLGRFQNTLNQGRDQLPANVRDQVLSLTSGVNDNIEKAKLLYSYLQKNTRYISIQLGVGGWQPFDVSVVANKGYGDCKALSNYMYSLLKAAGVTSHYVTIMSGSDYDSKLIMEDFPSMQANHVVLCVPNGKDTLWLECTSQIDPAGYMGNFTGNRKALLVTENGGQLVSTPRYKMSDNLQVRTTKGILNPDGNLQVQVRTLYKGIQQDQLYFLINTVNKDKLKEILTENLDLPDYDLKDFNYVQNKSTVPEVIEDLNLDVRSYATITGKRLFITPNILSKSGQKLLDEDRKYDLCFSTEYKDIDTVVIDVPEGWEVEAMPQPVKLNSEFGQYNASFTFKDNKITYVRMQEYFAGRFPATKYKSLVSYYNDIYKADRSKMVLVKKEGAASEKKSF